jgi:hypothetical protein
MRFEAPFRPGWTKGVQGPASAVARITFPVSTSWGGASHRPMARWARIRCLLAYPLLNRIGTMRSASVLARVPPPNV